VIINTGPGEWIHAKGYSALEVQKLLQVSTSVSVIDTKPVEEK